ncbi:Myo-inositol 2-dehydrogenase [Candidatus Nitrosotalea sp. TS]|uniref:Gfo/Idh/MocA family protein n=1 Tax=Candidatus Nitrosotalea sp. TS TaxID=2341020 RepID=UPI00140A0BB1|nr:Gfo/Idh/MocA family oxidoreductase [Candidatus Nitrosotalea sp. TS]NHI03453.1 Myo-inositol 2-dehydrogenase [Candidatus Nitrosotalea sp. TS]
MKIVQIGVGGFGKNHTRILSQLGVLSAVCDADSSKAKEFGTKYSVNHYSSVDSLLGSEQFDAAFVCTPTSTHFEIAKTLLQKKKNVFVEKPMTYLSREGEELLELAKKNKATLTSGYIERFNPAVSLVKEYVKTKKYGELIMLEFHRENRMPPHIKDVGIIYDTSVHDIDTAMWLFDDVPEVVFARSGRIRHEHEDFATIMLGFRENKVAIISSNWITPIRVRKFNAVCGDAIISSDFITQEVKIETNIGAEIPRKDVEEPLLLEIKNFIAASEGKENIRVRPEDALNTTKIAEAALLSSQKGTPIYLDLK